MIRLATVLWLAMTVTAMACQAVTHRDRAFTVCTAQLDRHDIALRLYGLDGEPLGGFGALDRATDAPVVFAVNGGMYHADRSPVGLYIEDGARLAPIVTRAGPGNFGMLPNGVFCLNATGARVYESRAFEARGVTCRHATQSGPMLVIDGALHPRFLPDSTFLNIRNGVGATPDGRAVYFAISDEPVSFHQMATLFRDQLGVRDALYLDGRVSRLYAPAAGRADVGRRLGPMIVVTERTDG